MVIPALIPLGVRAAFPSREAPPEAEVPVDADGEGSDAADATDGALSTGVVGSLEGAALTTADEVVVAAVVAAVVVSEARIISSQCR